MQESPEDPSGISWRTIARECGSALRTRISAEPEQSWSRDPAKLLALAGGFRAAGASNPYAAEPYLDAADALLADGAADPGFGVLASVLRSVTMRELGRHSAARSLLRTASASLATAELSFSDRIELSALVVMHEGFCELQRGDLDSARRTLVRGLRLAGDRTAPALLAEGYGCTALIELRTGSLRDAEATITRALDIARSAELGNEPCTAPARLAQASLAIERGQLEGVGDRLAELARDTAGTEYEPLVLAVTSVFHESVGADDEAMDDLQELQLVIRDWESPSFPRTLHDYGRVGLLVRHQETATARAQLTRLEPDATHSRCPAAWSARIALDTGDYAGAIELTTPCLAMGDTHAPRTATLANLANAAAHDLLGDIKTADTLFARALLLASSAGLVRPFGFLPRQHLTQLVERAKSMTQPQHVRRMLEQISARLTDDHADGAAVLSPREHIVLERLVEGDTQQRISFELSVSPNTVKTQLRSIYRKLGVTTRDGAVQRARTLGIIG
ncbi:response regulator transcription factor [Agromyces sp. ISL-38]|uniref:helix-turn-helix transcriptional regulator n=1 Tax=Agromyces sp. ISL-38 TaxID=2819107 RepID=UPI001BE5B716|nr:LuxR C-terminal-related transcriptional regulator [Agromyces sp. ISL-38]MBT2499438.1 response regulator transcription factor [Agromyces sp. ISL-38]